MKEVKTVSKFWRKSKFQTSNKLLTELYIFCHLKEQTDIFDNLPKALSELLSSSMQYVVCSIGVYV